MNTHPIEPVEHCPTCGYIKGSYAKHVAECPPPPLDAFTWESPDMAEYREATLEHMAKAIVRETNRAWGLPVERWEYLSPKRKDKYRAVAREALKAFDETSGA